MFYLVVDVRIGNWMRDTGCRMVLCTDLRSRFHDTGHLASLDHGSAARSAAISWISAKRHSPHINLLGQPEVYQLTGFPGDL